MDDFSRYIWVRFLQKKSQAFECFRTFKLMRELQLGIKIEVVWSDHGRNFFLGQFQQLIQNCGIYCQLLNEDTLEQNGVAKRTNHKFEACGLNWNATCYLDKSNQHYCLPNQLFTNKIWLSSKDCLKLYQCLIMSKCLVIECLFS